MFVCNSVFELRRDLCQCESMSTGSEAFMRPRELKKLEHEAPCTLLDAERCEFVAPVGLIVNLVPLTLEARAKNYVWIRLMQPATEQRLHRLLASVF